jgi:Holliday junction resolvasome RuvABC ATP-dependent DNA helicase subunit
MTNTLFANIVGQDAAKKKLSFYLESYRVTRIVPNFLMSAPKGCGKTLLSRELAKGLVKFDESGQVEMKEDGKTPRKKSFIEVNCSSLKSVKQFINGLVIPLIQDKDVTVLFDEASELPHDITMALLTILNPNTENRTSFSHDEYVCDFDFRRQTFLFATSEVQKVFHALVDRLKRIDLEEYTPEHLAAIVQLGLKNVKCKDNVLFDVATVLRGNARAAQMMTTDIQAYLQGRTVFDRNDWNTLRDTLGILPLGLSTMELSVLRYLMQTNMGVSLTCLSAKTGLSRDALQRDTETYLQKHSLMRISTGGREITAKGLEYVRALATS